MEVDGGVPDPVFGAGTAGPWGAKSMFGLLKKRRVTKFKHKVAVQLDGHNWASKMETHRLVSSKSFVKLAPKSVPRAVH